MLLWPHRNFDRLRAERELAQPPSICSRARLIVNNAAHAVAKFLAERWVVVVCAYSLTKGQATIIALTRAMRDTTGNMPSLPGIFPDYSTP